MPTIVSSAIGVSITRCGAEVVDEPLGDLERAAVGADVLAEHVHALVALHLLPQRLGDRDQVGGLAVLGALAARFGAVPGGAGLDLLRAAISRPPSRRRGRARASQ